MRLAKKTVAKLRQTSFRVGKLALIKRQRYAHAKQFKRANRALRTLRTHIGRTVRDITLAGGGRKRRDHRQHGRCRHSHQRRRPRLPPARRSSTATSCCVRASWLNTRPRSALKEYPGVPVRGHHWKEINGSTPSHGSSQRKLRAAGHELNGVTADRQQAHLEA